MPLSAHIQISEKSKRVILFEKESNSVEYFELIYQIQRVDKI